MKLGTQYFDNEKGAIIIGLNGSGKSTILNQLKKDVKKEIIKYTDNNDNESDKNFICIDSETHIKEVSEGTNSLSIRSINNFIEKMNIEEKQPKKLFNTDELNNYKNNISEKTKDLFNKNNVFNTNLSIKYIPEIKIDNLLSAEMIIELNGNEYDLKKASSGMKSIISLALNNLNDDKIEGKVIAIDEIENFLHPEWIELAAFLINILFEKNIIIITTHSPLLLSLLLKENPEILSRVEKDDKKNYGSTITWNYQHLKEDIKNIILEKMEIFKNIENKEKIDEDYADKFIKFSLNDEISMIFFWEKPRIVEGLTEKTYLEQKYNKLFISAGGFHQFIVLDKIINCFNDKIDVKFLMDYDKNEPNREYNNHVFNKLKEYKDNTVYRISEGDFDKILNSKISKNKNLANHDKLPNAIDALIDGSNIDKEEMKKIETFFKL